MVGNLDPVLDLQPGEAIVVVTYTDESARLTHGEVVQFEPLVVRLAEPDVSLFLAMGRAMLIVKGKTPPWFARTTIASCTLENGSALVKFDEAPWELEDRRKYQRVALQLPVELRLVHEQPDSLSFTEETGVTEDISLGGASVRMNGPVPVGMLVEFRWKGQDGASVRSLGIVLHEKTDTKTLGIEFVNFIGEGKAAMQKLISEAA